MGRSEVCKDNDSIANIDWGEIENEMLNKFALSASTQSVFDFIKRQVQNKLLTE